MQNTRMKSRFVALAFAGLACFCAAAIAAVDLGWLALCGKCVNPTVFSTSGLGSANAVAEARITRGEIEGWCANWQPGDKSCVKQQLATEDLKKVYRASANCTAGSITPVDGKNYKLAGVWDNSDIGVGRSKWRDASGKIVGRDNASGGLSISQQWELLCPAVGKAGKAAIPAPTGPKLALGAKSAIAASPAGEFAVGQAVLARYGRDWVRGRVNAVRHINGQQGPVTAYDVSLDNGKRGMLPQRMLRKAP